MATLCEPIELASDLFDPNIVKVVTSADGRALYFSRAPIPWDRDRFGANEHGLSEHLAHLRHLGIYAYRASLLRRFVGWPPANRCFPPRSVSKKT